MTVLHLARWRHALDPGPVEWPWPRWHFADWEAEGWL